MVLIGETDDLSIDLSTAPDAVIAALEAQKEKELCGNKISGFDEKIALIEEQAS